jgi:hypothetical protein
MEFMRVAAYLPREGVVIGQIQVPNWGSEPNNAPRLLGTIDLRGTVVTGDAIFASRKLSLKILQAKGDYLWMIKENQVQMFRDIEALFEPQPSRPGWSAPPMDFRSATSFGKGHGRLERRRITVSSLLTSYSEWPGLSQVFKIERVRVNAASRKGAGGPLWHDQFAHLSRNSQALAGTRSRALGH